ncbi:hypothetical protein BGZ73_007098 [Actinomortierella ambigua]|nr:hypothetical protein BGZ73_007098 [Actinomortierella ambigua]
MYPLTAVPSTCYILGLFAYRTSYHSSSNSNNNYCNNYCNSNSNSNNNNYYYYSNNNYSITMNTTNTNYSHSNFRLTESFADFATNDRMFTNLPGAQKAAYEAARDLAETQNEILQLQASAIILKARLDAERQQLAHLEAQAAEQEKEIAMLDSHADMLEGSVEWWHSQTMDSLAGGRYSEAVYNIGVFDTHRHALSEWQQALSAAHSDRATLWHSAMQQRQLVVQLEEECMRLECRWSTVTRRVMVLQQEIEMAWILVRAA